MNHTHGFDEALISGYLDGELTQGEEQRVRLHLEDCAQCRGLAEEMRRLREATMKTEFEVPDDNQWDEAPQGGLSGFLRSFGWLVTVAWLVAVAAYAIWQIATESENLFESLLVFSLWAGIGLLFLSVLLDRLKSRKTDRYLRVKK